jgi:two-component system chemotaxis response regulator CheB
MGRIRVAVIDDSALARKVLKEGLAGADDLELCAAVGATSLALAKCATERPDVIVLDLCMADEDWRDSLAKLRRAFPLARLIALAPASLDGRAALEQALAAGANDSLTRPESDAALSVSARAFGIELVSKVRGGSARAPSPSVARMSVPAPTVVARPAPPPAPRSKPRLRIDVLAIGVSTGGPNALTEFLPALPADFPVPIVLVQHMPPGFTANLANNLDQRCRVRVREAAEGDALAAGQVLIAPGDYHMALVRRAGGVQATLHQGPPENFCRPAVDVLFRSVAEVFAGNVMCLVLTGMGQDGMLGAEVIGTAGGIVLAQDEASSVVWGMPGAVVRAGLADAVLPLKELAGEVDRRVRESRGAYARGA